MTIGTEDTDASGRLREAQARLAELFGFAEFRPGQAAVVDRALAGRDTLAIMPTGSGKSVCYQLPAALLAGCVVVVSPLIALMKDQVESLPPELAGVSTLVNSTLDRDALASRLAGLRTGAYRLLYVAPERLRQAPFLDALARSGVALFVVDEAHCVSLWGHDFRPDYLFIGKALRLIGNPPVLALTATATAEMTREIGQQLGRDLDLVRTGVLRSNLFLEVVAAANAEAKLKLLVELCGRLRGSGIVYVNSRERAEELARLLRRNGVSAGFYHAGLTTEERNESQNRFMRGQTRVVVATTAFGMGIDKADVRFIVHFTPPESLERYVQESGRAGRDGEPARCIVLYTAMDRGTLSRWRNQERPKIETLRAVYKALRDRANRRFVLTTVDEVSRDLLDSGGSELDDIGVRVTISMLERVELAIRHPDLPRTLTLRLETSPSVDPELEAFALAARLRPGQWLPIDALDLSERSGVPPSLLEPKLLEWQVQGWLGLRSSGRELLIELLPPPADTARRTDDLLRTLDTVQTRRLASLFDYLETGLCRHERIARHFGVAAPARCEVCDNCNPAGRLGGPTTSRANDEATAAERARHDLNPAYVIVQCVRSLPYAIGRTKLSSLLTGSITSTIRENQTEWFGALAHLKRSQVERLIEEGIAEGFLRRLEGEYPVLELTAAAEDVSPEPPARPVPARMAAVRSRSQSQRAVLDLDAPEALDDESEEVFQRLRRWRRNEALKRGVSAFVVASDRVLRAIAHHWPTTPEELLRVPGLGATKTEQYGTKLLAIVAGASGAENESGSPAGNGGEPADDAVEGDRGWSRDDPEEQLGDEELLREHLRAWRAQTAAAQDVPPGVVLPERSLQELVERVPVTMTELQEVYGIGPVRAERYGRSVLALIASPYRQLPLGAGFRMTSSEPGAESEDGTEPGRAPRLVYDLTPEELERYERLREWRRNAHGDQRNGLYVPPTEYVLQQLARRRPQTLEALASVSGIGPVKVELYGQELLQVLNGSLAGQGLSETGTPTVTPATSNDSVGPKVNEALSPAEAAECAADLTARLEAWRQEIAEAREIKPASVVSDRVVRGLVALQPTTIRQLLTVPGLSAATVDRYWSALLAIVASPYRQSRLWSDRELDW
ncbi:MAG: RecQ family ATP-dependent DNA helicase [Chloroflexi bacterium]|nr:RecQ family ATP-dependent DNA helicase [Chloroflexota bacterium]